MSKTAVNAGWSVVGLYERPGAIRLLIHPFASRTASGSGLIGGELDAALELVGFEEALVLNPKWSWNVDHVLGRHLCSDSSKEHRQGGYFAVSLDYGGDCDHPARLPDPNNRSC